MNRLKNVTDNRLPAGANATNYSYDAAGNVSGTALPNGVQINPNRDAMNRITGLPVTSAPRANYTYSYGPVGNRLSAAEASGRSAAYGYDSVYRLTQEAVTADPKGNNGALGYSLDPVGNRLSLNSTLSALSAQSFSYDPDDRIAGNTYDANGNTLVSGARSFGYDSLNQLVNFNNGAITMVYDGDGNRVAKGATQYLVDANNPTGLPQVVEEISGSTVTRTYTYGLGRISQRQLVSGGWQASFYGYDAHGDMRFLMDPTGTVSDTYDYDAWGNTVSETGSTPNVFLYQGEQSDSETHLYYLRARYFDSLTGRFLSVDPLADQTGRTYLYASADPVDGSDPNGLQDLMEYRFLVPTVLRFFGIKFSWDIQPPSPASPFPTSAPSGGGGNGSPNPPPPCKGCQIRLDYQVIKRFQGVAVHTSICTQNCSTQNPNSDGSRWEVVPAENLNNQWPIFPTGLMTPLNTSPDGWAQGYFKGDPLNNFYMQSQPKAMCDCIQQHAAQFKQSQMGTNAIHYRLWPGPNSNTFIGNLTRSCGLSVTPPVRAANEGWYWKGWAATLAKASTFVIF
ncbi:MAG: RHS repeat-associated core domain-containing protein, partial [Bryobacteraceae bacterium]